MTGSPGGELDPGQTCLKVLAEVVTLMAAVPGLVGAKELAEAWTPAVDGEEVGEHSTGAWLGEVKALVE